MSCFLMCYRWQKHLCACVYIYIHIDSPYIFFKSSMLSRKQSIVSKSKHTCVFACNYRYTPTHMCTIFLLLLENSSWRAIGRANPSNLSYDSYRSDILARSGILGEILQGAERQISSIHNPSPLWWEGSALLKKKSPSGRIIFERVFCKIGF